MILGIFIKASVVGCEFGKIWTKIKNIGALVDFSCFLQKRINAHQTVTKF